MVSCLQVSHIAEKHNKKAAPITAALSQILSRGCRSGIIFRSTETLQDGRTERFILFLAHRSRRCQDGVLDR
jgi:hypothetical protein